LDRSLQQTLQAVLQEAVHQILLAFASANAQEFSKFTFDFGGGYTAPAGATCNYLGWGWNIEGGAGFNFSPYIGAKVNLGYDSMSVNSASVAPLAFREGR
jgi:hypothetical protein